MMLTGRIILEILCCILCFGSLFMFYRIRDESDQRKDEFVFLFICIIYTLFGTFGLLVGDIVSSGGCL